MSWVTDIETWKKKMSRVGKAVIVTRNDGYADRPGSGPEGETCKTCKHYYRKTMSKAYLKCNLMRKLWTGGPRTDIKAASPACSKWEKP